MLTHTGLWVGESGGRQAWVPASYFNDLSPIPTAVGSAVKTAKPTVKLERAQQRLSVPKLPAIDNSPSEEQNLSLRAKQINPNDGPLQQLYRKFSWESNPEEERISIASTPTEPPLAPLPQLKLVNHKFSWCSDDNNPQTGTPDLIRSSSLSSSSTSSTSSTPSTSTGSLKFDPIIKDLIVVGNDSDPTISETQNLHTLLDRLLGTFSTGNRKGVQPEATRAHHLGRKVKQPQNKHSRNDPEVEPQAHEPLTLHKGDDIGTEGMLINRRHPLRSKKRRHKSSTESIKLVS
jgi:hypothetical protein